MSGYPTTQEAGRMFNVSVRNITDSYGRLSRYQGMMKCRGKADDGLTKRINEHLEVNGILRKETLDMLRKKGHDKLVILADGDYVSCLAEKVDAVPAFVGGFRDYTEEASLDGEIVGCIDYVREVLFGDFPYQMVPGLKYKLTTVITAVEGEKLKGNLEAETAIQRFSSPRHAVEEMVGCSIKDGEKRRVIGNLGKYLRGDIGLAELNKNLIELYLTLSMHYRNCITKRDKDSEKRFGASRINLLGLILNKKMTKTDETEGVDHLFLDRGNVLLLTDLINIDNHKERKIRVEV